MIRLTDTLTGEKEPFQPIGDPVLVYVCGITPYSNSHVGHAMSAIAFDTIRRYLEWSGYRVKYVQNFTDIDDKIIARANEAGEAPQALAERYIQAYFDAMAALNVKPADVYPRATGEIPEIIAMVSGLIERGRAYPLDGDVYYRVMSDPNYGKLSHRTLSDLEAGARVEIDERKEHPMDFALWKGAKPGEPSWPSPWGPGRPGWHIECSAMVRHHLGDQIDIHGGGADLIFPHHENEIAQSEGYTGCQPFARYWLHNGLLQLGQEKMSKSLGNLVTIEEALERYGGDAIRMFVLSSHYRSPLTWTDEGVQAARRGVERLRAAARTEASPGGLNTEATETLLRAVETARDSFKRTMDDDFNAAGALGHLFDLAREINRAREAGAPGDVVQRGQAALLELTGVLGLRLEVEPEREVAAAPFIELLIEIRQELRTAKQWALADRVRDRLAAHGVTLLDTAEGTTWRLG